jgi:hypothetical protein
MSHEIKKCLFLNYTKLPPYIQYLVEQYPNFNNDSILNFLSEFDLKSLSDGTKSIEEYWNNELNDNPECKSETLEEFIKDYNLEFEEWIINQKFDLKNIDQILINVSW